MFGWFLKKVADCTQVHDMWPFGPLVVLFFIKVSDLTLVGNLSVFVLSFILYFILSCSTSSSRHISVSSLWIHLKLSGYDHNDYTIHCMNFGKNPLRGKDRAWSQSLLSFIIEKLYILSIEIRISPCDKLFNEKEFTLINEIFILKPGSLNAGENSFKIGQLVFEILHNQYFQMQYLLQFQCYWHGVFCHKWSNVLYSRTRKDF